MELKPAIGGVISGLDLFATPLWGPVFLGLVVGWAWRPRWAGLVCGEKERSGTMNLDESEGVFLGFQSSITWLNWFRAHLPSYISFSLPRNTSEKEMTVDRNSSPQETGKLQVTLADLQNLFSLVETADGGPAWINMMDKSLENMSYQAWRRDPEKGPPQYRSRTIFDDATPEIVRDFFWDDEFRIKNKWDGMLLRCESLEECPATGSMIVHWVRKFPFFCSDREYCIGRRIWEVDGAYYCVTKGVPFSSIPRRKKPMRVDVYYSSWCIRAVESRRSDGQITACEVLLFHHEDMGIPREIAKLGVRQGMWCCVKKIEPGLRAYQAVRKTDEPLSHCALIAQMNTKVSSGYLRSLEGSNVQCDGIVEADKKSWGTNIPKFVFVSGALVLACTADSSLITKAIIFGVVRRFTNFVRS